MIRSHDDAIRVEVVDDLSNLVPVVSDFSIINLPLDQKRAQTAMRCLFDSPTERHTTLILNRHRRKDRLAATMNLKTVEQAGFEYLDTVSIWYEKPSSCSNNGFLPVCEVGHLFYKGPMPDVKTTKWFGEETSNATNLWNVTTQEGENKPATYFQKFCWELPLLLLSMSRPLEHRRFMFGAEITEPELDTLFRFVKHFNIGVSLFTTSEQMAIHIIRSYEVDYAKI